MAQVVLLRGVNVGGHRSFRPSQLAGELKHLDVVNIGAAGTFVVRQPVTRTLLRAELAGLLPFETEIMICEGREILDLVSRNFFAGYPAGPDLIQFVSILAATPRLKPSLPVDFPSSEDWMLKVIAREGRLVVGLYRRHMKAIGYLGSLDKLFGVPATTRNWNTISAIARVLGQRG